MATVDVRQKRVNEISRMSNLIGSFTEGGVVTLDAFFPERVVAKAIHVGTAGNLVVETPYTKDNVITTHTVLNAEVGYHWLICTRVLSAGTTATNLTWHTGE